MKLRCPHCTWSLSVPEKRDANELINHIFVVHWRDIRLEKKKEDQKKFRVESNREREKEKRKKKKRDQL